MTVVWIVLAVVVVVLLAATLVLTTRRRARPPTARPPGSPPSRPPRPPGPRSASGGTLEAPPRPGPSRPAPPAEAPGPPLEAPAEAGAEAPGPPPSFRDRLGKARGAFSGVLGAVRTRERIDPAMWGQLEEMLIRADVGVGTTTSLLESLRTRVKAREITGGGQLVEALRDELPAPRP